MHVEQWILFALTLIKVSVFNTLWHNIFIEKVMDGVWARYGGGGVG